MVCFWVYFPYTQIKIHSKMGSPMVAMIQAPNSLSEPGKSRTETISVAAYKSTSSTIQIMAAICLGLFFMGGSFLGRDDFFVGNSITCVHTDMFFIIPYAALYNC